MPQLLKSAPDGRVKVARFYSAGQVAVLMGAAHSTVLRLIEQRELSAFRMPTQRRDRRIVHNALIMFVRKNPEFRYMLDRLDGYDPGVDFPISAEPTSPPVCPVRSAPRSGHRPRSAFRGKIPRAGTYSTGEIAFLLGRSRRCINSMLDARILVGMRIPSTGLTSFTWRISDGSLAAFLRVHPEFAFASGRIRDFEAGSDLPAHIGEDRSRKATPEAPPVR
jgi:excisionase family DNA binding protein